MLFGMYLPHDDGYGSDVEGVDGGGLGVEEDDDNNEISDGSDDEFDNGGLLQAINHVDPYKNG